MPVYNSYPYLRQCIRSILKQTYKNFELIIINDGSTDESLEICQEYKTLDERIILINQINKGISSSRNLGLSKATGEYIYWIDSDDWIEEDTLEILYNGINKYSSDIAVCGYIEEFESYKKVFRDDQNIKILNKNDFFEKIIFDESIKSYLWDKLYKKEIFENLQFPEQRYFEDYSIFYKIAYKTNRIILINQAKYHYRQHNESICRIANSKKEYDFYLAIREKMDFLSTNSQLNELGERYKIKAIKKIFRTLKIILINNDNEDSIYKDQIINFLKPYLSFAKQNFSYWSFIKFYLAIYYTGFYSWFLSITKNKKTYQKV
ncbi:Glycosyltransferase involved in cell wall bisynthesis [Chishuiella changwenlii]|uniref:Glycosyltransferase involved in cell wall bisynthesis n=1 Tax=Chishuiella changwenlii TaxID=1434701 RepID=A0A1M6XZD3_9FLAO|nr:Glycosyltransferase involved in cell wall bisynthesis [Chishuiella changwenlii]